MDVVEAVLDDGSSFFLSIESGEFDVGAMDRLRLDEATRAIRRIASWVDAEVRGAIPSNPDSVGVEFGIKFAAKSGTLTSVLAEASGEASLVVKLQWDRRASAQ